MPLNHTSEYAQLTDKQFELLGRAVVEWSNVEFLLGQLLTRLLHTPDFLGRTYTDQMSAYCIEVAIKNALEVHANRYGSRFVTGVVQTQIRDLLSRVCSTRSLRNKISHFCWSRSTDDEIFGIAFSGETPESKRHHRSHLQITNSELEQACQQAYELVDEIDAVIGQIAEITEDDTLSILRSKRT